MDNNKECKRNRGKRVGLFMIIIVVLLVFGIVSGCIFTFFKGKPIKDNDGNPTKKEHAELILRNLAVGMRIYSAETGGGGEIQFTGDITKIQRHVMQDAFAACSDKVPYHGFIVELLEYPEGDDFKTNFRFVAKPAAGYTGSAYAIDKTEEVISFNVLEEGK